MSEWRTVRSLGWPMYEELIYLVEDALTAPEGVRVGDIMRITRLPLAVEVKECGAGN